MLELLFDRISLKGDVENEVLPLVAPVSDDTMATKFEFAPLLPLMFVVTFSFQLGHAVETGVGGHEFEN